MTKVLERECRFAIHMPSKHPEQPDVHLIKEVLHLEGGTTKPNIRFIKDYVRPFWVTLPRYRSHKQKKEVESLDKLMEYRTTQSNLRDEVAKALDRGWSKDTMRTLSSNPYLYGSDITSTSLIKQQYMEKYPNTVTQYSIGVLDIETDVLHGTEEIVMITLSTETKSITAVVGSFISGIARPVEAVNKAVDKYISEYVTNKAIEIVIADTSVEAIKEVFKRAHEWMPDWIAVWNIDFDVPKILSALEKAGVDPKDVISDPRVPKHMRICKYKQGAKKKITASGKETPISPASQWHTFNTTSSFYFMDAMCAYKQLRISQQEEPSYALDAILNKELGIRKLKFKEADAYTGLKWHQVMQRDFKVEYVVYNIFDCISILELDKKTKDLASTLPTFSDVTDFSLFKSQPRRIADNLHRFCIAKGLVISSNGRTEALEEDILSLKNWILTLPSHLSMLGKQCILEDSSIHTGVRCYTYDSDAVSAYPSASSACNVSRRTTVRELVKIAGVPEKVFRMQNLNLILGKTNSLEYCTTMFKFKKPQELLLELK